MNVFDDHQRSDEQGTLDRAPAIPEGQDLQTTQESPPFPPFAHLLGETPRLEPETLGKTPDASIHVSWTSLAKMTY
ncbi:hypothetical protein L1887_23360 [Cichorium endivia]|nr:hypothetical protein L1887_23360 [Cichorium endivia]